MNDNNIQEDQRYNYKKCEGEECETYGTPYDCMSIMNYRDYFFKKAGATGPTMTAKNPATCNLSAANTRLTNSDITLLKRMYCDQTGNNIVTSPNWGQGNYPSNLNEDYPIKVEAGSVIEIFFTDFMLETHESCRYDWVRIVDGDGTELLKKVSFSNIFIDPFKVILIFPNRLVERTNLLLPSGAKQMRQQLNFILTRM